MEYRNPIYTATGDINCEIEHWRFGWIPFTASANDTISATLFAEIVAAGGIAPYVAPPSPTAEELLAEAREQAVMPLGGVLGGMVEANWLPEQAAQDWLDRVALPAPLVAELASLPSPKTRLIARAALFAPTVWRLDPVWTRVFARFGKTDAEIDAVFDIT